MTVACPTRSPQVGTNKRTNENASTSRRVGRALSFKGKKAGGNNKKQRKSRVLFHYTKEELEPYFHISQKEAAKRLGVAVITLKRICKRGNFNWPFRANKSKEVQERNDRAPPSPVKSKAVKKATDFEIQREEHPAFEYESRATQQEMCHALRSLAMCAFKLEQAEYRDERMSSAALEFSRLPLLCMLENDDMIQL